MKRFALLFLSACSGDAFTGFDGGLEERKPDAESSSDADSGSDPVDSGGLDAGDSGSESSTKDSGLVDTGTDSYICPTGVSACNDAITAYCARLKGCNNTQCSMPSTAQCNGKMVCETACLSDIQNASCTKIEQSVAPAFISSNCMGLWQ